MARVRVLSAALGAALAIACGTAAPTARAAAPPPAPAPSPTPAPKPPLPMADRALASWAEGFFPWGDGEMGVEKAARSVPGWNAWKVTKRFPAGFEDRVDVLVSADGKSALLGAAFVNEDRAAAPAPLQGGADAGWIRDFVNARVLGPGTRARVRTDAAHDVPGFRAFAIALETGYGPYDVPLYVSEKDGALFFLGSAWRRDRTLAEQRRERIDLSATPVEGPADAKVTLVEYSDMQCPMCKRRASQLSALLDKLKGELPVRRYV